MRGDIFLGTSFKADMISQPAERKDRAKAREKAWQVVRTLVLKRDSYRCRVCRSVEHVDVHHIQLRSAGGDYSSRNLVCLCRIHHREIHMHKLHLRGSADGTLRIAR